MSMKNRFILIFFYAFMVICIILSNTRIGFADFLTDKNVTFAKQSGKYDICVLTYDGRNYRIDIRDCMRLAVDTGLKENNESLNMDVEHKKSLVTRILNMGFAPEVALCYSFYGLREKVEQVLNGIEYPCVNSELKYNTERRFFYVVPEKSGIVVDRSRLYADMCKAIYGDRVVKINTQKTIAEVKSSNYPLFRRALFSTSFYSSGENRKHNIYTAIDKISGLVLQPGEEFSFNKVVGRRTEENGFSVAKIISNGEYIDGLGGGVCQVSTTLYNAAVLAGLEIVESHSHSLKPSYVKSGFDAMVNYGTCDLKFRNNTAKCIGIIGKYTQNECFFEIFGEKCRYNIKTKRMVITTKPQDYPEYIFDIDAPELAGYLPLGTEKVLTAGKDGEVVDSFVELYENGRKVKEMKLRRSTYNTQRAKIVVGTCL